MEGQRRYRVVGYVGAAILLLFAWTGISGFASQWPQATDAGRLIQTIAQLLYGMGALLLVAAPAVGRRLEPIGRLGWILGGTIAGGLAPLVWGDAPLRTGAFTFVASLGLTLGVLWLHRRGWPVSAGSA